MTDTKGASSTFEWLLEPDEAALIVTIREAIGKVNALYDEATEERRQWEATHDSTEPYVALDMSDSKGAAAYSECPEAMAVAALAAFNLVARALGVSGWQASYAELEFLRRSRRIEGPFGIYDFHDALYPQYDVLERIEKSLHSEGTVRWLGDEAEKKLAETTFLAAPRVLAHWRMLVAQRDALPEDAA
jgi:hypothetical protein